MPISPIQRYWVSPRFIDEFGRRIPQSWPTDEDRVLKWLYTRWGGSAKFAPQLKDFLSTWRDHPLLRELTQLKTRDNATC